MIGKQRKYIILLTLVSALLFSSVVASATCSDCDNEKTTDGFHKISIQYSSSGLYYNDESHKLVISPDRDEQGNTWIRDDIVFYNVSISDYQRINNHDGIGLPWNSFFVYQELGDGGHCVFVDYHQDDSFYFIMSVIFTSCFLLVLFLWAASAFCIF